MTAARTFRLDGSWRRPADGRVIVGGSPLRLLTVAAAALPIVRELERSGAVTAHGRGVDRLIDRMLDLGMIHPAPAAPDPRDAVAPFDDGLVTVVTPSRCDGTTGTRGRRWSLAAVLVDDGSSPPLVGPEGTTVVRQDRSSGPGAARNSGLEYVRTPFVAFVDDDVEIDEAALVSLLRWFDDPQVALVAPRIRAVDTPGALARFEATRSPLDLGPAPARVAPTTRVSYVPAAAFVCRTDAIRAIGGFDPALRYGEDVDLVWRLVGAGWRCRYEPSIEARHHTRPSLPAWLEQRVRYGTSAAPLATRHPGALAPIRMSGWSAAVWAPAVLGFPVVGAVVGAATSAALVRRLPQLPAREALRIAGLGNLFAGRLVAATLTRAWWPVAALAALVSRRARRVVVAATVTALVLDACDERPRIDPVRWAVLHLLDDLAYGAGVWIGAWRARSVAALRPAFESWPPSDRAGSSDL
ncbi:MAG: mycofactocin biosynthesis glycosyltransferase MftF [Acidimicrobiales bacterium]|nr:mycofactocin biosynthesis glycosyltransferase MftF [Acidimicrobiales bacterium]MCB9393493.1 mycofactocin biosynthesis glycosyltransferase MftF [Acidimicrobiaceae bacterium]